MEGSTVSEKRKSTEPVGASHKKAHTEPATRGRKGAAAKNAAAQKEVEAEPVKASEGYTTDKAFKELLLNSPVESLAYVKKNGIVFFVDRSDKISDVFKVVANVPECFVFFCFPIYVNVFSFSFFFFSFCQ